MKLNINSKGQIVGGMDRLTHYLGIQQRLWLNKLLEDKRDWLYSVGYGSGDIERLMDILSNDCYDGLDRDFLNRLRDMYIESFVYGVNH